MSVAYQVTVNGLDDLVAKFGKSPAKTSAALQSALVLSTIQLNALVKRYIGMTLHDTGKLMRSIKPSFYPGRGVVGTNVVYAKIHEYGGTIYPKTSRYLTVPLNPEAKAVRRANKSLKNLNRYYIIKSKNGNLLLMDKETKEPAFLLVSQVTIRAKPYMRPAAKVMKEQFVRNIRQALKGVL